jgi:hypothetical protein
VIMRVEPGEARAIKCEETNESGAVKKLELELDRAKRERDKALEGSYSRGYLEGKVSGYEMALFFLRAEALSNLLDGRGR